jgi:ribosomal protein L19
MKFKIFNPSIGDVVLVSWKLKDYLNKIKIDKFKAVVVSKKVENNNINIILIRKFKNCIVKQILPLLSKSLINLEIINKNNKKKAKLLLMLFKTKK